MLIEHSSNVSVVGNVMTNYQFGVLVDWGDHNVVRDNTIVSTTRWMLDPSDPDFLVETDGIVVMNGTDASVVNNDISVAMFGFMGCIDGGLIKGNAVDGCLVGIAFCRVPDATRAPPGSYIISGVNEGGNPGGAHWMAVDNVVTNSVFFGYVLTDGANHNKLVNNAGANNGYGVPPNPWDIQGCDIELLAAIPFFGFDTPASHDNLVVAGSQKGLTVQDCGVNNMIIGDLNL